MDVSMKRCRPIYIPVGDGRRIHLYSIEGSTPFDFCSLNYDVREVTNDDIETDGLFPQSECQTDLTGIELDTTCESPNKMVNSVGKAKALVETTMLSSGGNGCIVSKDQALRGIVRAIVYLEANTELAAEDVEFLWQMYERIISGTIVGGEMKEMNISTVNNNINGVDEFMAKNSESISNCKNYTSNCDQYVSIGDQDINTIDQLLLDEHPVQTTVIGETTECLASSHQMESMGVLDTGTLSNTILKAADEIVIMITPVECAESPADTGCLPTNAQHNLMDTKANQTCSAKWDRNVAFGEKKLLINKQKCPKCLKHKCTECGKRFQKRYLFKAHMRMHSGLQPFQCKICSKIYQNSTSFQTHMVTHTNISFTCELCGKSFKTRGNLYTHMRSHDVVKKYVCTVCGKRSSTSSNNLSHMKTHSSIKTHECNICRKDFRRQNDMRKHKKKFHPNVEFS